MRALAIAIAACAVCAACKKSDDGDAKWDPFVDRLQRIDNLLIRCRERSCVDEVEQRLRAWRAEVDTDLCTESPPKDVEIVLGDIKRHEANVLKQSAVARITRTRDELCGCMDAACAKRLSFLAKDQISEAGNDAQVSADDERKVVALAAAIQTCAEKLLGAAAQ